MQFPSAKVVAAVIGAILSTAAVVLASDGMPTDLVGWLAFAGKVAGSGAVVGALGYAKTETNPPAELVARIRAQAPAER